MITEYKDKKFLGWKAEKTLLDSILAEKLKNALSCRNKCTYKRQIRAARRQDLLRNGDFYGKLIITSIIHISYNPKHKIFLCLSVARTGTDVQPVVEEKIMPIFEENNDFFM
jgi:hypothetical protein